MAKENGILIPNSSFQLVGIVFPKKKKKNCGLLVVTMALNQTYLSLVATKSASK